MMSNRVIKLVSSNYLSPLRVLSQSRLGTDSDVCNFFCSTDKHAFVHTTSQQYYPGQNWRKKRGMPANYNAYGPLTDGPDYSFLDGRATPPGTGKINRAIEQKELATKIMKLSGEVDFAVANHESRVKNKEARRKEIIESKLKPKGNLPPETRSH